MFHSKVDKCAGKAANEYGQGGTAHDHGQCGRNNTASNEPPARSPRLTLGVRTDIDR